jgi:hypothetical protein
MNFNRRVSLILGLIVLGIIIGSGALLFGAGKTTSAQAASPALAVAADQATSASSEIPATPPPAGYLPYSNQQYHFAVYYPPNLQLHTYDEDGGGFTAAFQNPTTNVGFEVYVTPYSGTQITEQEFKLDEPSGVENGAAGSLGGTSTTSATATTAVCRIPSVSRSAETTDTCRSCSFRTPTTSATVGTANATCPATTAAIALRVVAAGCAIYIIWNRYTGAVSTTAITTTARATHFTVGAKHRNAASGWREPIRDNGNLLAIACRRRC